MNAAEAQRLLEEQTAAIQLTEQRADQLQRFKDDYDALSKRLETLPDKVTHDVMVPFGKLAFMPGQLVHTNEVLVLLGDNWFVERSAKQARDIIERRVDVIKKQLTDLEDQKGLLEPRRQFTEDLWEVGKDQDGAFEIREEYDEAQERRWKEKHRENMKMYKKEQKKESDTQREAAARSAPLTDAELWARLDQLEEKEMKDREMEKLDDDLEAGEELSDTATSRTEPVNAGQPRTQRDDDDDDDDDEDDYDSDEEEDSDDYEDDDEDEGRPSRPTSIRFSHTKTDEPQPSPSQPAVSGDGASTITSPADIYARFMQPGPRSILKSPGTSGSTTGSASSSAGKQRVTIREPEQQAGPARARDGPAKPQPQSVGPAAFTGDIVERHDITPPTAPQPPQPTASQPKISKFKAQRMRQQNR